MTTYHFLKVTQEDGVATVMLGRPEALNALTPPMLDELHVALRGVACAPEVRVLVITGSGRGFCAGADQKWPVEQLPGPNDADRLLRDCFEPLFRLLVDLRVPTVAALNGVAAG